MVKRVKEGLDSKKVSQSVKDAASEMTAKEVDDFASTKHKDLPEQVDNPKND